MQVIQVQNPNEGAKVALGIFQTALAQGAQTLGLATGSTPVEIYRDLVASELDFSDITSVNLDEYVGLAGDHEQSYRYFMDSHLFNFKPFKETFVPDGTAQNPADAAKAYDEIIAAHPIDLQLLGIGRNGHIGFNEPGTSFDVTTHVVDLEPSTIEANARFFASVDDVPKQALSMGIASILKSKQILLVAYGADKAEAVAAMLNGEITPDLPASVLQKHANVTVLIDDAAASRL
ncbi:MAG TPA: glucosamine-6-phosphate deaminase [Lactobacillaceae bacterium]|jgi:glucosamine-6-phosphate deaminase